MDPQGMGYTGHLVDEDTDLIYMQARYYDPSMGRFMSVDPLAPSPGRLWALNRYTYANNNGYRYTDPTGACGGNGEVSSGVQRMRDASDGCGRQSIASGIVLFWSGGDGGGSSAAQRGEEPSCAERDGCLIATAMANQFAKMGAKKLLVNAMPAAIRPWVSAVSRGLSVAARAKAWGSVAADINDRTFSAAIEDIEFKQQSETFGPTGRQYQGSLINWGRLDWGPYDSPQMSLPAGQVYYNFATDNVVNGPRP
jgi:RHS repeat-associated protein